MGTESEREVMRVSCVSLRSCSSAGARGVSGREALSFGAASAQETVKGDDSKSIERLAAPSPH